MTIHLVWQKNCKNGNLYIKFVAEVRQKNCNRNIEIKKFLKWKNVDIMTRRELKRKERLSVEFCESTQYNKNIYNMDSYKPGDITIKVWTCHSCPFI